ncbi:hypothetical protein I5677_06035 [Mobilitalea sibirica]|uniref:Uncharacterized protein n=1 Tax=Mobilitalea sibirica TaxID=1462919 RepID=A0A8J7H602_9FIRM|nr:DUF6583 family protein [Mobilitalea sibirica]MBH1940456.1 hypothetical protein [Mobilitalea sibirica]
MDDMNKGTSDQNQNPENTNQNSNDYKNESGNTYWETQNQDQAIEGSQTPGASNEDTPAQFYQNYQQQMSGQTKQDTVSQQTMVEAPKKKSRGKLIASVIIIVLLVSGAVTAFAMQGKLKNTLALNTKSPEEYYTFVEKQFIKDSVDKMMANSASYDFNDDIAYDISMDLSYDKTTVSSLLQSSMGMTVEDVESMIGMPLDSIGMDMIVALTDKTLYEELGVRLNQVEIITLELFMDMVKEEMLMRLPELSEAYLKTSLNTDELGVGTSVDMSSYFSQLEVLTNDNTADFLKRYGNIIAEQIDDVELTKNEEVEVGDIKVDSNLLTVTIDNEDLNKIASEILKEAKNDEFILALLPMMDVTEEEFQQGIEQAMAQLSSSEDGNDSMEMKVFVDGSGKIIGRDISIIDNEETLSSFGYYFVNKGKEAEYEFFIDDAEGNTMIGAVGNHTKNNDAYDGEVVLEFNDPSAMGPLSNVSVTIKYEDVKTEMKDKNMFQYGKFTLSSPQMLGMELDLEYDVKDEVQLGSLALRMGSAKLVTLDVTAKYLKDYDIPALSESAEVYDTIEADRWAATFDTEKFITDLSSKLGVDLETLMETLPYYFY